MPSPISCWARSVASTSPSVTPEGSTISSGPAPRRSRLQGGGVDVGVLPNLERREVEAERLDLPDEVLELAGGDAFGAVAAHRLLHQPQVGQQLVRRAVRAAARRHAPPASRARVRSSRSPMTPSACR